jgi:phenol hydroxylase P4 protein
VDGRPLPGRKLGEDIMAVTAIGKYEFEPLDKRENFHGNIITYWHWRDHLMFCSAVAFPLPPDMPFRAVVENVLKDAYSYHPDFARIDWAKVEWQLNQKPFTPALDKSLAENGLDHKSLVTFRTPGLTGIKGSST